MKTFIAVYDKKVCVELNIHAIRIYNDEALVDVLKQNGKTSTQLLIKNIKVAYLNFLKEEFKVSDASIAVEIWGHVYVEKFAKGITRFLSLKLIQKILDKIIYHCQEIDIGERGHDNNRFVWDLLSPFKKVIETILFAKQKSVSSRN